MKTPTETDDRKLAPTTFALLCKLRDGDGGTIHDMEEIYEHAVKLERELRLLVAECQAQPGRPLLLDVKAPSRAALNRAKDALKIG